MTASKIKIRKVCGWCGQEFLAQKITTMYCCKNCSCAAYKSRIRHGIVKSAEQEYQVNVVERPIRQLNEKAYLDVSEAAQILGLTRMSIYNLIYAGKLRASRLSGRMTFIKREDIDAMLSAHVYTKSSKPQTSPITDFYTTAEIKEKYGVSEGWIFKVGKEKNIPKVFKRGKTYWSKKHIDQHIVKHRPDQSITEWYTTAEIMAKFQMSLTAVYSFVSKFAIPRKKIKREVFYSKRHVDAAKGITAPEQPEYYTIPEAMTKFHMTRDQLYHYAKRYNVPRIMEGKYAKYSKKELDAVLAPPSI